MTAALYCLAAVCAILPPQELPSYEAYGVIGIEPGVTLTQIYADVAACLGVVPEPPLEMLRLALADSIVRISDRQRVLAVTLQDVVDGPIYGIVFDRRWAMTPELIRHEFVHVLTRNRLPHEDPAFVRCIAR